MLIRLSPDAEVSVSHNCDGDPTLYISLCLGVESLKLCGKVAGQALQRGLRFYSQNTIYRDDERRRVVPLLHTGVKALTILFSFCHLQDILQLLRKLRLYICVNHTHVQDSVCP